MHHIVTLVGRRHKGKPQKNSVVRCDTSASLPKPESEKMKDMEATGPCHVDLGPGRGTPLNGTPQSNDEDVSTCNDDANTGRPPSRSFDHSLVPARDLASPPSPNSYVDLPNPPSDVLEKQRPASLSRLRRSKSILGTLSKKLRPGLRVPSVRHMPSNPLPESTQLDRRQTIYRPQAVPVVLSDDPVSKERRDSALRARGLLPSRQPRDLSAIEADADRRSDALRKSNSSSSPGSDSTHSDANEIAQTWRDHNSQWLSYTPPNSDSPVEPVTEDASSFDTPSHLEGSSEPPTAGADTPALIAPDDPSSISKPQLPGSLVRSLKAYSSRGSIGHQNPPLSRAASVSQAEMPESPPPSPCPASPSSQSEDLQAPRALDQLPSEPHNPTIQANISIPASPPLYLYTTASDTFLASPTTPTLSPSVCYSSEETEPEDGLPTTENGEHDASPVSPTVKGDGGFLCHETILEGSESLSDDDDVDQFHTPPDTAIPIVDPPSATDGPSAAPRRTALLSRLKTRGSTLRPSSPLSTSTSMVSLRRKVSGTLFGRTRRLSMASDLDAAPRSPPPSRLAAIKIYDGPGLSAEASGIDDDEARRLSELAFLT